jgi:hypothetical protein
MSEAPRYEIYSVGETYSIIYKVLGRRKRGEKSGLGSKCLLAQPGRELRAARVCESTTLGSRGLDDQAEIGGKGNGVVTWVVGVRGLGTRGRWIGTRIMVQGRGPGNGK